jgi:2-polyprenyl-6-methoxyphenol hydroxylase-like FAD-dependent oxidoreductase
MSAPQADVVVVGAGPVGLLAALAVVNAGLSVVILEKNSVRRKQSRAIGITPPTLGTFGRLGIVDKIINSGVKVSHAGGYTRKGKICTVNFDSLKSSYPFVLAIPQDRTESLLESEVLRHPEATLLRGGDARTFDFGDGWCSVTGVQTSGREFKVRGRFVIGCDGAESVMRKQAGACFSGRSYPHTFLMADYKDPTDWGDEARLYFTARGSVESFPLPEGYRRFVIRTKTFIKEGAGDHLSRELAVRCGVDVYKTEKRWESAFGVQHYISSTFAIPRLFLCGDAAHVMSPIGGQNMNTGFADAELAVWLVSLLQEGPLQPLAAAEIYDRTRRKAVTSATGRAELMMRAGTSGGVFWNMLRNPVMGLVMKTPLSSMMNGMFTMLSLPNKDLPSCRRRLESELGL